MRATRITALAAAFTMLISTSVYGFSIQDLLNKQRQIERNKDALEKKIDVIKDKKDGIEDQMAALNARISKVQDRLDDINGQLIENEYQIDAINKQVDELNKKSEEQKKTLQARLKVYYENGEVTYLDLIINSTSFSEMLSRMEVLKQIIGFDKNILVEMQQTKDELDKKKSDLEIINGSIVLAKQQVEAAKKEQTDAKAEKQKLLSKLTDEQRRIEKQYEEEEDASNDITAQIQRMQGGGNKTPYTGGKLGWPTPGYFNITSVFGMRLHPILKVQKMHTGIDVGAPMGANMAAAGDGTVIGSSFISGYGNTVIIDHGGGISTLYAHNSSLLVSVGQKVKRGQIISKVGSTGNSTGPHAHFEVRVGGKPVNPMDYLNK